MLSFVRASSSVHPLRPGGHTLGQREDIPAVLAAIGRRVHELAHQEDAQSAGRALGQRPRRRLGRRRERVERDALVAEDERQLARLQVERDLGDNGRVVLRKSGTEPLLRVMVEANTQELCNEKVDEIIDAMAKAGKLIKVK